MLNRFHRSVEDGGGHEVVRVAEAVGYVRDGVVEGCGVVEDGEEAGGHDGDL